MENVYDGLVSRHLNRRVSRPLARLLSHTPATPNQVSVFSLLVALGAFFSFVYWSPIAGGLLAQASSVVDGIDGDLARLKRMTSAFGGFMDSIVDRYTDTLVVLGLALWTAGEATPTTAWLAAVWALAGSFAVTYTRARIEGLPRNVFDSGITSLASRDVRLLVVMVGSLAQQGLVTLIILAVLTNGVVLVRLVHARRLLANQ
jgi:phosphatidylglycerophosphate synthase